MLLRLAAAYAAGMLLPWAAAVPAALPLALERAGTRLRVHPGWLPALGLALGLGLVDHAHAPPEVPGRGADVVVDGWVASTPQTRGTWQRALVEIEHLASADTGLVAKAWDAQRLRVRARRLPAYGKRCRLTGRLRAARRPRNFEAYDERSALGALGAAGVLEVHNVSVLPGRRGPAWRRELTEPLRRRLARSLHATLETEHAGILAAVTLGVRDRVDRDIARAWRSLGITHVLAISGMHVGLVAGALLVLGGSPRRRRGLAVLLVGLGAYAALGGVGPTVLRASLMAVWGALAVHLGRDRRPLVALGMVSLLLVLHAPERRHDLGMQLSCLSTLGILVWAGPLSRLGRLLCSRGRRGRVAAWIACSAGIGMAAQTATLPLALGRFGYVSWCGPLANLLLVPLVNAALVLALAGTPLQLVSEALGRPLWILAGGLLDISIRLSDLATGVLDPRVFLRTHPASLGLATLTACALLAAGVSLSARRRHRTTALLGVAVLACVSTFWVGRRAEAPAWRLEALDVGQGDCVVLTLGRQVWVIDAGDSRPIDHGERTLLAHLRRLGIRRLRGLVLTHPHRDHYGGAAALLRALRVDTLYVARVSEHVRAYERLRDLAPAVPVRGLVSGELLQLGADYGARVLWPQQTDRLASGPNARSLVLWARGGGHPDLLAMGDLEADGEAMILERWRLPLEEAAADCLVLKAGHHGSDTSSSKPFLDSIDAELAIVSVGERNHYGHPSHLTLAALREHDCTILRTDRGGAVRLVQRGTTLWLERPGERPRAAPGAADFD